MVKRPIERRVEEPGRGPQDGSDVRARGEGASRPSLVGQTILGKYEIVRKLGEGGLGDVYAARQLPLGREVALKLLHENLQHKGTLQQRFAREAKMLVQLKAHPNIVHLFDFDTCEHGAYIVMDKVEGVTLSELLLRGPLVPSRALGMMKEILAALDHAHRQGVIHRDLKPGNVMIRDGSDHVVVLDFGLARLIDDSEGTQLTRQGAVLGTPAYMAPEQATGDRADPRADVYSAGLVLFEMLAGRRAFLESEPAELLKAHLLTPPPTLAEVGVHASPALEALIARALSKEKQERFPDAAAMFAALEALPPIPPEMDRPPTVVKRKKGAAPAVEAPATVVRAKSDRGSSDAGDRALVVAPALRAPVPLPGPDPKVLAKEAAAKAKEEARLAKEAAAKAKEEARRKAENEAQRKAQEEAKKKAEAEAKRAKEETKRAKEEAKRAKREAQKAKDDAKKIAALAKKQAAKAAAAKAPSKRGAPPGRKTSKLAVVVVLGLLGGIAYGGVWLATRPTAPESETQRNAPVVATPPTRGSTPRAARRSGPRPAAKNPFAAGVPSELAKLRRRIARGDQPSRRDYSVAVAYSRDHADDPRGELLLAHTFADRHWWSDSLERYRSAYARDPSCRGDPTMLPDLLKIVVTDSLHREGAAAVVEIYGAEALPAVERALARAQGVERERLGALRARLARR